MKSLERIKSTTFKVLFLVCINVLLFSCGGKTFDNEEELLTFLKDESNGYLYHKNINGYDFTLMYRPTDLLINQELDEDKEKNNVEELKVKYGKLMYFTLNLSKDDKEMLSVTPKNRSEFSSVVNKLVFGLKDYVYLQTKERDTIEMIDYIYPRFYGMGKSTNIMFIYPKDEIYLKSKYISFTIKDLGFYTGDVKFKVDTKKINEEPTISF